MIRMFWMTTVPLRMGKMVTRTVASLTRKPLFFANQALYLSDRNPPSGRLSASVVR
nr:MULTISPECIES: hypothetical protein [unclassified Streptomyces]